MKNKRLFLAIPLTEEIKSEAKKQEEASGLSLKWLPEKNLHITVHFFGNVAASQLEDLKHTIRKITLQTYPFTLEAECVQIKNGKVQHMVWVAFKKSPAFEKLALKVAENMGTKNMRKPVPHINLARSKTKIRSEKLPVHFPSPVKMDVNQIELWESKLSPEGSTYFPLERFTLKGE